MNNPQIPLAGSIGAIGNFALMLTGPVNFASDADHTMVYPETVSYFFTATSGVSLTAQRKLISPLIQGLFSVYNNTTGGQAIQVIGASGTGAVIPNGQVGIVYCDGANYILTSASGGVPAGPTGAIQYNGGAVLAGSANAIVDGSGNANLQGQMGVGLSRANTSHVIDSSGSSNSTTVTGANPVELRIGNTDTTVNNYEGIAAAMTNSTPAVVTAGKLAWVNTVHTAAAESADLHLLLRNAGTLTDWFTFFHDGGLAAAGATGGDKGAGTGNFTALYQNNVPVATTGTAVLLAPAGAQTVTQPVNTSLTLTTSGTGATVINNATVSGGTINGTSVGASAQSTGRFTTLEVANGAVNAPALFFAGATTTGLLYDPGTGGIDFFYGPTNGLRVESTGISVDTITPLNGTIIRLQTTAANWTELNSTISATSGANQNSPSLSFAAQFWNGTTSVPNTWKIANILGTGTNPTTTLTFTPAGGTGAASLAFPAMSLNGSQIITTVQGTTGNRLAVCAGSFTNGNLRSTDASGNEVDAGVAVAALVAVGGSLVSLGRTTGTGAVTLATPASNSMWRVSANVTNTVSAAGATVVLTVSWTDTSNTAQTATIGTATATTLGAASQVGGVVMIAALSGTAITVQGAITGTPTFDIRAVAEELTKT